jgi:hypothetical protein
MPPPENRCAISIWIERLPFLKVSVNVNLLTY